LVRIQAVVHLFEALGGGWVEHPDDRTQLTSSQMIGCVFHSMPVHDFSACRSKVSRDAGPGFHGMPVQDFTPCRSKLCEVQPGLT